MQMVSCLLTLCSRLGKSRCVLNIGIPHGYTTRLSIRAPRYPGSAALPLTHCTTRGKSLHSLLLKTEQIIDAHCKWSYSAALSVAASRHARSMSGQGNRCGLQMGPASPNFTPNPEAPGKTFPSQPLLTTARGCSKHLQPGLAGIPHTDSSASKQAQQLAK